MGKRRRKKLGRKQVRSVPQIYKRYFTCPRCGKLSLSISLTQAKDDEGRVKRGYKHAVARCGSCHLRCEIEVVEGLEKIDVYNMISDAYYEGSPVCMESETGEVEGVGEGSEHTVGEA